MSKQTKSTVSAAQAYEQVRTTGVEKSKPVTKTIEKIGFNEGVRQGDLYIMRIKDVPADATPIDNPDRQLVPGTSQGSRHCITAETFANVKLLRLKQPTALQGPVIKAEKTFEVEHPEHGHFILPPGIYQAVYQRAYAEELRRVQD